MDTKLEAALSSIRTEIEPFFAARSGPSEPAIPLSVSTFGADEVMEVLHSLLSGRVTKGKKVARFESEFADYLGARHAIMVNSGSSANLLMMAAAANPLRDHGLRSGDEVLVPAVTWSTTLWPVINLGCVPVLVDADLATLNMSVDAAAAAITPKTRAILVAHILGNAADLAGLRALVERHGLILLEDTCESLGTRFEGRFAGTFGLAGTFSFYFSHHITTVEGGMVVTDDDDFADLCRCLRAHGWTRDMRNRESLEARHPEIDPRFLFVNVGYNLRPTELQGAFGIHQLPRLEEFNRARRTVAARFREEIAPFESYLRSTEPTPGADHTWFGFPVLLTPDSQDRRNELIAHLEAHRIETRPIVAGNLAVQPALKHFDHRVGGSLENADRIMRRGVYWGVQPDFGEAHAEHLGATLRSLFGD